MISYYFGSKEKLMETIFEERTKQIRERLESLLQDESLGPFEKIWVMVDEYIERSLQKQQFNRIMFMEQMLGKNGEIRTFIRQLKQQNATLIEKIIKDGQKKKVFKKNIDVVLLINIMTGIVHQSMVNQDYYRVYHNLQHLSDEEVTTLLKKKVTDHLKICFTSILKNEE